MSSLGDDLGPEARGLFARARGDLAPREDDRRRVEKALAARLGVAVGSAVAVTAVTSVAKGAAGASMSAGPVAGASVGLFGTGKWVIAMVALAGIGVGGASIYRARTALPPPVAVARTTAPTSAMTTATTAIEVAPPPSPAPSAEIVATAEPAESAVPFSEIVATPKGAPKQPTGSVAEEAKLIRDANAALHGGNAAAALGLLDEHMKKFPSGVLSEERSAVRIFALCALGRVGQAQGESVRFLKWHPNSPFAKSIRESCGGPKTP